MLNLETKTKNQLVEKFVNSKDTDIKNKTSSNF